MNNVEPNILNEQKIPNIKKTTIVDIMENVANFSSIQYISFFVVLMAVFSILRFFMLLHGSFTGDNHLLLLIFKGFDVVLNILSAGCLFRILYNSKNKSTNR